VVLPVVSHKVDIQSGLDRSCVAFCFGASVTALGIFTWIERYSLEWSLVTNNVEHGHLSKFVSVCLVVVCGYYSHRRVSEIIMSKTSDVKVFVWIADFRGKKVGATRFRKYNIS